MVYFPPIMSWSIKKVEQSSERGLLGAKACNVSHAEILSFVSYVIFALFS